MSDSDRLASSFDVIVLGTGLPESIIAAACAKSGKSVLHIDRNDHYGGIYSSFNLKNICELENQTCDSSEADVNYSDLAANEQFLFVGQRNPIRNIRQEWHVHNGGIEQVVSSSQTAADSLLQNFEQNIGKFNIDIWPKILLSKGEMVKLLCASKVNMYCEFKLIDRILRCVNDNDNDEEVPLNNFRAVPFSRADIFQTDELSRPEKRRLMRFLSSCYEWLENGEEFHDFLEKPFSDFLNSQELTCNLKNIIMDTVGILHSDAITKQALSSICQFLNSTGVYGNSPFLWTMYGSSDLPQGFCRACAVHGGIYCLKKRIDGFILSNERVVAVVIDGERIKCEHVVMNSSYLPDRFVKQDEMKKLAKRAIIISDQSLLIDDIEEHLSIINLTRVNHGIKTQLLEMGRKACVSPKNFYVNHLISNDEGTSHDLSKLIRRLWSPACLSITTDRKQARMFWSMIFDVESCLLGSEKLPVNMRVIMDDDDSIECTNVAATAQGIFEEMLPEDEYFPVTIEPNNELFDEPPDVENEEVESF